MNLCHYLTPHNIVTLGGGLSKEGLLKELVKKLAELNNLPDSERLAKTILDREAEGSTFLPTGIAIPHARVADVSEILLVLGVLPEGFKENAESDPIYLVFLFLSPTQEKDFGKHLKLLARIAAIFRDPEFVKSIAGEPDHDKIFSIIQHAERETLEGE